MSLELPDYATCSCHLSRDNHLPRNSLDMCILELKKGFARLIFFYKKFQEMATKSLFLSFENSFSASYFPKSKKTLEQNSSFTPLWTKN